MTRIERRRDPMMAADILRCLDCGEEARLTAKQMREMDPGSLRMPHECRKGLLHEERPSEKTDGGQSV